MLNIVSAITGGPIVPFTPSSIAGLKAWYDASDTATISLSGSAVTQWNDKSGNSFNLTQATALRRPQSGVNTLNSLNVITFDGNDVLQAATASDWTFLHNSTGATIFFAAYFNTVAVSGVLFATASSTAQSGVYIERSASDLILSEIYRGSGGTFVSSLAAGTLTDNTAKYASMVLDNSNATAANRLIYKINAGSNLTGNTYTGTPSASAPNNPLYIGSYDTAGSSGFQGRFAEIIMYSGVLSGTDITNVNSYLSSKWAI
tara:strand:+ start:32 stop:811 length:780 start_codon:yes stop_codon:yes gene_type:complete